MDARIVGISVIVAEHYDAHENHKLGAQICMQWKASLELVAPECTL